MSSATTALIVFVSIFSGALCGLQARAMLPAGHLEDSTLSVVKLATGLIATMSALVLGLLISSAKGSFDRVNDELLQNAARIMQIDHLLGQYGPETTGLRKEIKASYSARIDILVSGDPVRLATLESRESLNSVEELQARLQMLAPRTDAQRALKDKIVALTNDLASTRALVLLQKEGTVPLAMLITLTGWLAIIFASFGLCSPRNGTTLGSLFIASLCATAAIYLILEMDRPLDGLIKLRELPLRAALKYIGD